MYRHPDAIVITYTPPDKKTSPLSVFSGRLAPPIRLQMPGERFY